MSNRLNALILATRLKGLDATSAGARNLVIEFVEKHGELLTRRCCDELYKEVKKYLISVYDENPNPYVLNKVIELAYKVGTEG